MMGKLRMVAAAAAFSLVSTAASATDLLVINSQAVFFNSAAAADANTKLTELRATMAQELRDAGFNPEDFESQAEQFASALGDIRTAEEFEQKADADLKSQRDALQSTQRDLAIKGVEYQLTQQATLAQIYTAIGDVLEEIRVARGADLIIEAGAVSYIGEDSDLVITQDALDALNAKMPTVTITREPVPQEYLDRLNAAN